jgi:hypothetical protein
MPVVSLVARRVVEVHGDADVVKIVTFIDTCIPDMFLRHAAPGDYRVLASMPDRDGDHMYRIKSPLEEHDRVVKESASRPDDV